MRLIVARREGGVWDTFGSNVNPVVERFIADGLEAMVRGALLASRALGVDGVYPALTLNVDLGGWRGVVSCKEGRCVAVLTCGSGGQ